MSGENMDRFIEQGAFDGVAADFTLEDEVGTPRGDEKMAERELFKPSVLFGMLGRLDMIPAQRSDERGKVLLPKLALDPKHSRLMAEPASLGPIVAELLRP